jgi:RimJ/RimL family protein N-acetyltransferase
MPEPIAGSVELAGDGLRLRAYRDTDADALYHAARESIDSVGRWLPWCHAGYAAADARSWIAHCAEGWSSGEHYAFAIFEADTEFCGGVGLNQRNRAHNFMNLGYWTRASRQGRGLVRRAARLVAAFGFEQLGLTRIEIVTAPDNLASRKVAEALGATFEGLARNRIVAGGRVLDALVYSLIPAAKLDPADQEAAQICAMSS